MDKKKSKDKNSKVVDLSEFRKNKNEERRREYERVLFNRVLGVYSFVEKTGLHHVEVVDISLSGIRIREEKPEVALKAGTKAAFRFYFTPSTYLRLLVEIKRTTAFRENHKEGLEYGCEIDKGTKSYEVLHELIDFMQKYSEVACHDDNPPMIFF
jgi:hypothetical protein